jgi:hypothetical protein
MNNFLKRASGTGGYSFRETLVSLKAVIYPKGNFWITFVNGK